MSRIHRKGKTIETEALSKATCPQKLPIISLCPRKGLLYPEGGPSQLTHTKWMLLDHFFFRFLRLPLSHASAAMPRTAPSPHEIVLLV